MNVRGSGDARRRRDEPSPRPRPNVYAVAYTREPVEPVPADPPPRAAGPRASGHDELFTFRRLVQYGSALALIDLLAVIQDVWAAQVLLIPLLLTVPGCLLLHALRVPGAKVAEFPLYVPTASLVALMVSGLAVDLIGPLLGVHQPLRPAPLLVGLQITCLLLFLAGVPAPRSTALLWRDMPQAWRLMTPMVLPLVAAIGALRLNNGHGSAIAVLAVMGCVAVLVIAVVRAHRLSSGVVSMLLYAVALAMMLSYALRSDLVYGFDIATEYSATHQTVQAGIWYVGPHPDAYGAMLSITVLPAQLHALSGLTDLMVLKIVFPAIFAMFPVGIFNIAERFLPRRWAALAAAYVLVQGVVTAQLPALARQEIALLLFLALCAALLDIGMARTPRVALVVIFTPAIVVSHYSSAYFAIMMLGGAVLVQIALWALKRTDAIRWTLAAALGTALVSAFLWYVPLTHSSSNLGQLRATLSSDGLQLLPHSGSKGLLASYLAGDNGNATASAAEYQREMTAVYAKRRFIHPSKDAGAAKYALKDDPLPKSGAGPLAPVNQLLDLLVLLSTQLANVLALVAAAMMAFQRRTPGLTRQVGLLALPALGSLVLFRFSGTLSTSYNQGRAQIQALTVVTVALFWMLYQISGKLPKLGINWSRARRDTAVWTTLGAAVLAIFVKSSGLSNAVLGGGTAANLSASGEDFERFFMYRPEIASAAWLSDQVRNSGNYIYSDRYGQIRLFTQLGAGRAGMFTDLAPAAISRQDVWIYADHVNVVDGRARSGAADGLATYAFPRAFINDHYDLVYTNGSSEVYRR